MIKRIIIVGILLFLSWNYVKAECLWPNVGKTCLVCHIEDKENLRCKFAEYGLDCMICHQYMSAKDEKMEFKKKIK